MFIEFDEMSALFSRAKMTLSEEQYRQFRVYADFLAEKNAVMNLTAITEPHDVAEKHFLDSVLPLTMAHIPAGASLVDVGAGAGFPSVPMKIMRPDIRPTLLDSLNKRVGFLKELTRLLGIDAECIHVRAEDAGRTKMRESFDAAVARAVSRLPVLCEYCMPLVKVGGTFLALKGSDVADELESSKKAIETLGGELADAISYVLPSGDRRTLVIIKKKKNTPEAYPRAQGKINSKPL